MAEALCGPSNPLQNFQKHASADRTIQQDRLRQRHVPHENFRSTPANTHALDAEFDAFHSSRSSPFTALPHSAQHVPPPLAFPVQQPQLPDWAADFRQMSLDEARQSPRPPPSMSTWANPVDTSLTNAQNNHLEDYTYRRFDESSSSASNYVHHSFFPDQQPLIPQPYLNDPNQYDQMPLSQQKQPARQEDDLFDDEAFERAFNSAREDYESIAEEAKNKQQSNLPQNQDEQVKFNMNFACTDAGDITGEYDFESKEWQETARPRRKVAFAEPQDVRGSADSGEAGYREAHKEALPRIGSDTIPAKEKDNEDPDREADELAKTAGQLLENLKHDHSDKFQNSKFLGLMRQLRDREVRVEGDQMVETHQALHPGGDRYPWHEPSAWREPDLRTTEADVERFKEWGIKVGDEMAWTTEPEGNLHLVPMAMAEERGWPHSPGTEPPVKQIHLRG